MTFAVHSQHGSAAAFHARTLVGPLERAVHVWTVERPALVLGSTQDGSVVDADACAAAGVEVVRRRSGGGAVLLDPGEVVWVDVELPRSDPLWDDDVGRAAWWLGERWGEALATLGATGVTVNRCGSVPTPWSSLVCFAGLGPGEVTGAGGAKLVGISQRRTRAGARFQCAVPLAWQPNRLASLLALSAPDRDRMATELAAAVRQLATPAAAVVDAFLTAIAR